MSKTVRANIYLTMCTIIWGGTFAVLKLSVAEISPLFLVSIRFGMAAAILFPFILSIKKYRNSFQDSFKNRSVIVHGFMLGAMMIAGFGFQTIGLKYTTASRSAFITELLILFTPFFQYFLHRRMPGPGNFAGMALILPGMYLLTSVGEASINKGDLLTFLCAIGFAVYIVFLDHYSKLHDEFILLFWQMLSTALFSFFLSVLFEDIVFDINIYSFSSLLYLVLIATLVAVYWQTRFQKDTNPVQAGILYSLEPVFATIFAMLFLSERPNPFFYSGAVLIIGGVIVSSAITGKKKWIRHYH